jgi:hypothetical protein
VPPVKTKKHSWDEMMHVQPFTKHARTDEAKNNNPIGTERNLMYKLEQSKAIVQEKMKIRLRIRVLY